MPGSQLHVKLFRDSFNTPWGFRLQGGKDLNQPLTVQRVFSNSPAEGELQRGDTILAIGGQDTRNFSHKGAQDAIIKAGGQVALVVHRPPPGTVHVSPLSPPIVTQRPRAPSLQDHQNQIAVSREDHSPSSPRRPNNIQHTPQSHQQQSNHSNHHTPTLNRGNNMIARKHNQPIHVHIEPARRTSQTNYYFNTTPSPQNQNGPSPSYGSMPRRQRGFSQPPYQSPTTPTIPPPPWATQQASPKKVSRLSNLGGGQTAIGTSFKSSTLPRNAGSYQSMAQHQVRRPPPEQEDTDENDLFLQKKPSGPPPKVCNLSNLGGGAIDFSSGCSESNTLPRRNIQRRLSQPPSMPSRSPYGTYQPSKPVSTPAQRIEPGTQSGVMLNRVQSTLDNITLSPRTPDAIHQNPWAKPHHVQQEPQFYTPTSLLLDEQDRQRKQYQQQQQHQQQQQQRHHPSQPQMQQQPRIVPIVKQAPPVPTQQEQEEEGEEPVVPVWERRRQFQGAPAPKLQPAVRAPKTKPVPVVSRPNPGNTPYTNVGLSYSPQTQQSNASWQPVPVAKPTYAPPPQNVHYSSSPAKHVQSPVKTQGPPSWARPQNLDDDNDGTPAWSNSLRSTGVKPWDVDLDYMQDVNTHEAPRAAPQPQANQQGQGQSQGQGVGLPGGRDWSQSQVFQFIQKDTKKPKGHSGPATAPKPKPAGQPQRQQQHHYQQPPQHQQQAYNHDVGISDF